jgi:hypothetical protein
MTEWQTIDTAPRTGEKILLYACTGDVAVGEWREFSDGTTMWEMGHTKTTIIGLNATATYWMPLPPPPITAEEMGP